MASAITLLWFLAPKFDVVLSEKQGVEQIDFKLLADRFESGALSLKEYMRTLAQSSSENPMVQQSESTLPSSTKIAKVLTAAKRLMGTPYKFGGNNGYGIDCSGFTVYAYKAGGVQLPRTATKQYALGTPVRRRELNKGDLVFFQTQLMKLGPSHVGIYSGDGFFYHASSSKGVIVSSLTGSYYTQRYMGARRVLK